MLGTVALPANAAGQQGRILVQLKSPQLPVKDSFIMCAYILA